VALFYPWRERFCCLSAGARCRAPGAGLPARVRFQLWVVTLLLDLLYVGTRLAATARGAVLPRGRVYCARGAVTARLKCEAERLLLGIIGASVGNGGID
jgi:hypothetical protein